jgi:hypothetical protein
VPLAEQLWGLFASHPSTSAAALRMQRASGRWEGCQLGCSAWNAYSVNIDFRTACHVDGKNMAGEHTL